MVIGQSETEGRADRSSASWRLGLAARFLLLVAVKRVRSDKTILPDALCSGGSSFRRRLTGLDRPLCMLCGRFFGSRRNESGSEPGGVGGCNTGSEEVNKHFSIREDTEEAMAARR